MTLQLDKPEMVCATFAVGSAKKDGDGDLLLERIVTSTYELCRTNPEFIPAFPNFEALLRELNATEEERGNDPGYQVTALHPSGALAIKESFFEQFAEIREFEEVVAAHNAKYNVDGVKLGAAMPCAQPEPDRPGHVAVVEGGEPMTVESLMKLDGLPKPQPSALDVPLGEINSLEFLDLFEVRTSDQFAVVSDRGFRRDIAAAKLQN